MPPDSDHRHIQRIGKGMLTLCWILILAGLTWYFAGVEDRQFNPNQDIATLNTATSREVVLTANKHHHYVATALINDHPVTVMLDTGASDVVIPSDLATTLGLKSGQSGYAQTANGRVRISSTTLHTLKLGDITLHNVAASINHGSQGEAILLGMSALKQLEFSQQNGRLLIRQYTP